MSPFNALFIVQQNIAEYIVHFALKQQSINQSSKQCKLAKKKTTKTKDTQIRKATQLYI